MFGHPLLGNFQEDPFFGFHQQQMSQMNQMMQNPFGMMDPMSMMTAQTAQRGPAAITDGRGRQRDMAMRGERSRQVMPRANPMDPFGMGAFFGGMDMFSNMNMMANMQQQQMNGAMSNPNGHCFSQSSVMTYSNTGDGAPKIYQATSAKTQAPGGVVETRKSVRDSEAAVEKIHVGRYIGDRGHTKEKTRNVRSGDTEQNEEYINQDEEELSGFNSEWQQKTHHYQPQNRLSRAHHSQPRSLTDGRPRYSDRDRDRSNHRRDLPMPAIGYRERD